MTSHAAPSRSARGRPRGPGRGGTRAVRHRGVLGHVAERDLRPGRDPAPDGTAGRGALKTSRPTDSPRPAPFQGRCSSRVTAGVDQQERGVRPPRPRSSPDEQAEVRVDVETGPVGGAPELGGPRGDLLGEPGRGDGDGQGAVGGARAVGDAAPIPDSVPLVPVEQLLVPSELGRLGIHPWCRTCVGSCGFPDDRENEGAWREHAILRRTTRPSSDAGKSPWTASAATWAGAWPTASCAGRA